MLRKLLAITLLLFAAPLHAATHTGFYTGTTGQTLRAFPANQSLADWNTYSIALTESAAPDLGKYTGSANDANGNVYKVFASATQPADWSGSIGNFTLLQKVDVQRWNGTDVPSPDTAGYPKVTIKDGTGTGEIDTSSGTITVGANNDKTGYRLSATGVDDFFEEALAGHVTGGSAGELFNWQKASMASSGVFSVGALANAPATSVVPVSQVRVPELRTWELIESSSGGLIGRLTRSMREGEEDKVFAVDYRNDLPTNGQLADVVECEIESGTAGGITFGADGVDKMQGKVPITAVTAGTYVIKFTVELDDASGGGTSTGYVTLIVVE